MKCIRHYMQIQMVAPFPKGVCKIFPIKSGSTNGPFVHQCKEFGKLAHLNLLGQNGASACSMAFREWLSV